MASGSWPNLDGSGLIPLNPPIPAEVEETEHHTPGSIVLRGRRVGIASIADVQQIDEGWWQEKPISRMYYQVITEDEWRLTIFRDLVDGGWYRQNPQTKKIRWRDAKDLAMMPSLLDQQFQGLP